MKRIRAKIILIILLLISICNNSQAAGKCKVSLEPNEVQVKKDQELIINVNISNIQAEHGIIAMTAKIEYDKNSFEFVRVEGRNWTTPFFNEENGKLAVDRNDYATQDETMFSIIFKVKEGSNVNKTITLKNIVASNGLEDIQVSNVSTTVKIENNNVEPDPQPEPQPEPEPEPQPDPQPEPESQPEQNNKPNLQPEQKPEQNPNKPSGNEQNNNNQEENQDSKPEDKPSLENNISNTIANEIPESNTDENNDNNNQNLVSNSIANDINTNTSNEELQNTGDTINIIIIVLAIIIIVAIIAIIVIKIIKKKNSSKH